MTVVARPWLKYAGGKTALLSEILPRLPAKIRTYYEPFVGAGAVFFALSAEKRFERAVIGDSNGELMLTYATLGTNPSSVIANLRKHVLPHNEAYYYEVRSSRPKTDAARAARFIYLNRTCFNGLYRVNRKGEFNVPFGSYKNPTICDEELLRSVATTLGRTTMVSTDFEKTVVVAGKGDAVYFDPPYAPLSPTSSFTSYTPGGFGSRDQERLRDVAKELIDRGAHVLLSNSDTPFVRELYRGRSFKIEEVSAPRRINSKGGKRGDVGELLISGIARRE